MQAAIRFGLAPGENMSMFNPMPPSRITLVAHTHWDREWYLPFEAFRAQLVEMLDEALDDLERDERLSFTLDGQVAMVDDYLELRPANEPRIRALIRAGRLHVGPWYTQADTLLTDGESLIRNLAVGIRRAEELGGALQVGYMPDQFGHGGQMPQLLRMFGIDGAVLWRGVGPDRPPAAFRWQAPDGSTVTTLWLQDGYGSGRRLPSDPEGFADAIERLLERLGGWFGEMPVLVPVGDDHVKLATWTPEAAAALKKRMPNVEVAVGGYHDHLPHVGAVEHTVRGELRSPAFAPVLAGVASARIREKQAAARAAVLLQRYAEPLAAWAALNAPPGAPARSDTLIQRAWRQLLLNHAHDSVAGCGVDATHDDVKARYRWAEQLAEAARDQALGQIRLEPPPGAPAHVFVYNPGPAGPAVLVEAHVPRAIEGELVAVGPDGVAHPVQPLGAVDERPVFEGEFSAAELGQYLGGLDPRTPIFGKYLTGITARPEAGGVVRLDVGLGEHPAPAAQLAEDQKRIKQMFETAERFKVVLHAGATSRPVLVQAGPAPEAGFVALAIRPGSPDPATPRAGAVAGPHPGISAGSLSVVAQPDGTVLIYDDQLGLSAVRANDLVDDGDRGDLYHYDPLGAPIRPVHARARVAESGPLRARLVVEQDLTLPVGLTTDRTRRAAETRTVTVTTEITLTAGERRIDFATSLVNEAADHRLRALVHVPLHAERLDVDAGLAVWARPLDPQTALGAGSERAAPTGQHHHFVDVSDNAHGVALMSRGLPEHEVVRETAHGASTCIALTLLRSVGWLSRGDLSVIDHAAGPMVPTPGAQELGLHRFEYALVLHRGDWQAGDVMSEARRYEAPAIPVAPKGKLPVPTGRALVEVEPSQVVVSALHPAQGGRGTIVRVLNASAAPAEARLRPEREVREALEVDPLERPVGRAGLRREDGAIRLRLGPWQLATVLLR